VLQTTTCDRERSLDTDVLVHLPRKAEAVPPEWKREPLRYALCSSGGLRRRLQQFALDQGSRPVGSERFYEGLLPATEARS